MFGINIAIDCIDLFLRTETFIRLPSPSVLARINRIKRIIDRINRGVVK